VRSLTHDDYISWLQLAQRTAWTNYVKTSVTLHATAVQILLSCATAARRMRPAWSDFRSLSELEQACWAFLALVGIVCIVLRVLDRGGL